MILPLQASATATPVKLTGSQGTPEGKFGISAVISGSTLFVGAPDEDHSDLDGPGAVYVFTERGGEWTEQQRLIADEPLDGQKFGFALAKSGDTLVIGAQREPGFPPGPGLAYVFIRSGGGWTQQALLKPADSAPGDFFGIDVAVDGDTAVVGTMGTGAYVFTRSAGVWTEQQKLTAADANPVGSTVALDGDTAVIGSPGGDVGLSPDQGAAYVFTRAGGTWTERATLTAPDGSANDNFGSDLALADTTIVVTAMFDDLLTGSAHVFTGAAATWSHEAKLTASDGKVGDAFGKSVAIDKDTVVVGAQWDDKPPTSEQGSAYVFKRSDGTWAEQAQLVPNDPNAGLFGSAVGVSGHTVLVGAGFTDRALLDVDWGAAYVFDLTPTRSMPVAPDVQTADSASGPSDSAARAGSGAELPVTGGSTGVAGVALLASGLAGLYGTRQWAQDAPS